jgi:Ca2+-binding RTX toxin-like protein
MAVTVPGTNGLITVSPGTGDVLQLASQIGALLATIQGANQLNAVTESSGSNTLQPAPTVSGTNELVLSDNPNAVNVTVPGGYQYVVDVDGNTGGFADTVSGTNIALVTGTLGGAWNVMGTSTLAATGGDNTVSASGNYVLSFGDGNNQVVAGGSGMIALGNGTSTVLSTGGNNLITDIGSSTNDMIVVGSGMTSIMAAGSGVQVLGAGGHINASLMGANATISAGSSPTDATISGTGAVIFGGSAGSDYQVTGTNATIAGGSGPMTVNTSSNAVMFGGTGPINFVGGAGTPTLVGSSTSGSEAVTVGAGGMVFSAGTDNASMIVGDANPGVTTIFGGNGSIVNYDVTTGGAGVLVASEGSETLNASLSTSSNTIAGGLDVNGADSLIGGVGNDTFFGGAGSDTMTGGGGRDLFAFFSRTTTGQHDTITDFNGSDTVVFGGYDPNQSATTLVNNASTANGQVTLTLSDNTQVTFSNISNASALNGHIIYG